jgi:hypothetical protein
MNVWIWGPPMWDLLHNASFLYDMKKTSMEPMTRSLLELLPCRYCRESYAEYYQDMGPPAVGYSAQWAYRLHQRVNDKLQKQRIEAFLESHKDQKWPASVRRDLVENFRGPNGTGLVNEPTFLAVQKRFLVNSDEPIAWRGLSTVLLALLLGLRKTQEGPLHEFVIEESMYKVFLVFLDELLKVMHFTKQSNGHNILKFLLKLRKALQARESFADLLLLVEKAKYDSVANEKQAQEITALIRAGACVQGTCK